MGVFIGSLEMLVVVGLHTLTIRVEYNMCQTVVMTDAPDTTPARVRAAAAAGAPGSSPSRQKILEVARLAFPANGYAGTSLRGIARDAGVDPSLIVQYFGSKSGLFCAVVEWPFDASQVGAQVREVPVGEVGEYMARVFIEPLGS